MRFSIQRFAFLAGLMIIPAVYVFFGTEGMASGPSLMFVSLPKVFEAMGPLGGVLGMIFSLWLCLSALTSSVSILETLVANCMEISTPHEKNQPCDRTALCGSLRDHLYGL